MGDLLAGGSETLAALHGVDTQRITSEGHRVADADLLAPVPQPGKIVAIGRNYREHTSEEGVEPPAAPLIFAKWPSSLIGHRAEVHVAAPTAQRRG